MANAQNKNTKTAAVLFTVVAGMVGLSFASVPLYKLFCQVTGLGGTPGVEVTAPETATDIDFKVRFDANTSPSLPWQFKPLQREIMLKLGEEKLAFYQAINTSNSTIVGTSTFNVTPLKAGQFFVKIDCFCFTEQVLQPGESIDMPVSFYIDPAIYEEANTRDVTTITLSYTFYPVDEPEAKVSESVTMSASGKKG